jgi:hypothetical protein
MPKFFSVLFLIAFSISAYAQCLLSDFGPANVSGKSIVEAPMAPVTFIDQEPDGVNGLFSDPDCGACGTGQQSVADNFTVTVSNSTTGITQIVIWGGYYPEDIPNTTDNFTFILHTDASGAPGTAIETRTGIEATSRVQTGIMLFGTHEYMFTFDFTASPFMLPSGTATYWFEIYNPSVESGNFYWETGTLDPTHGIAGSNFATECPGVTWLGSTGYEQSMVISGDDNIVPVELASFTASVNENDVTLNWTTSTETNNQGFEVQRSSGGEFASIAFVDGHGTTTESQYYTYTDKLLNTGSYSYRLKQVDLDGTFEYSNIVEVNVNTPNVFILDQNYPNPFNPSTTINFQLAVDSKVSLKVFNVLGQEQATLLNGNLVAGSHTVNFNASSLNSGVYMYKIEAIGNDGTNFTSVKKMILTK